jgi:hypothetical protein
MPTTPASLRLERATRQWLELSERRLAYYEELYRSGRWRHYFPTQELFAVRMLDAIKVAKVFRELSAGKRRPPPVVQHQDLRPAA